MIIKKSKQKGATAITVLVLVVLFSLVGVYMGSLTTLSSLNTMLSGGSIQSWFVARSGVEWAVHRSLNRPACTCATDCCTTAPAIDGAVINFVDMGTNGYTATISCADTALQEGSDNYCVYDLGITATRGSPGDETFASKTINITVTDRNAP